MDQVLKRRIDFNDFPSKVYLSASWSSRDRDLSSLVVRALVENDVTVVGDHPEYKVDDPFERHWTQRVDAMIDDCGALVAILPERGNPQTTSPYIVYEVAVAAHLGLPVLLFTHPGVQCRVEAPAPDTGRDSGIRLLVLGSPPDDDLRVLEVRDDEGRPVKPARRTRRFSDKVLARIHAADLGTSPRIMGPIAIPSEEPVHDVVTRFLSGNVGRRFGRFVFNIVPYASEYEHREIATAVFRETGLPCILARDEIGHSPSMRSQWLELMEKAEFGVAELTEMRDACLVEAGAFVGLRKPLTILQRGEPRELPYGIDDVPMISYANRGDLQGVVSRRCCWQYKRAVYNLDPDIVRAVGLRGVPSWFDQPVRFGASMKFKLVGSFAALTFGLAAWWILYAGGTDPSGASYLAPIAALISWIGAKSRGALEFVEAHFMVKQDRLLAISGVTFLLALMLSVYAWIAHA